LAQVHAAILTRRCGQRWHREVMVCSVETSREASAQARFKCPHCSKTFPSSTRFHKHLNTHSDLRLYRCTVQDCGKAYKRQCHLTRHLTRHLQEKDQPESFVCNFPGCQKSFTTLTRLQRHAVVHEGLACKMCGQRFRKRAKLEKHEAAHNSGEKPFKCTDCGETFDRVKALARHMSRHKQYKCADCSETFLRFQALVQHQRACHPKAHLCPDCGKGFRYQRNMRDHQRRVHAGMVCPCTFPNCGQVYSCSSNLGLHIRAAHNWMHRPWKCRDCGDSFALKHVYRRHRRVVHARGSSKSSDDAVEQGVKRPLEKEGEDAEAIQDSKAPRMLNLVAAFANRVNASPTSL